MNGFTPPGSRPDDEQGRSGWQPPAEDAPGPQGEQNAPTQPEQPGHPGSWGAAGAPGQSGQPGPAGQPAPPPQQPPHPGPYGGPPHPGEPGQPGPAGQPPVYGAQPPGDAGGPGGPGGPQGPGDGPAGPGGPAGSGGSGPGKGVILGIIGGVVGLVIIAVVVLVLLIGQGGDDSEAGGEGGAVEEVGGGAEADGAASAPDSAVEAYLAALADGDAETALSLIESPSDTTFLTDEVLAASLESAPIGGVEVTPVDVGEHDFAKEVTASYTVGDQDVTQRFQVYNEDGSWAVEGAASVSLPDAGELPLTINGVEASTDDAYVFMGTAYTLDVAHENFTLEGGDQLLADDTYLSTSDVTVALSESGLKSWRQVVSDAVSECLSSSAREPGCGLAIPRRIPVYGEDYDVVSDSIERTMSSSTEQELQSIEPQLDWANPNLASSYISGSVDVVLSIRAGGGREQVETTQYFADPVVDMAAEELTVSWE